MIIMTNLIPLLFVLAGSIPVTVGWMNHMVALSSAARRSSLLRMSSSYGGQNREDMYGAIHRKEHEMARFKKEHQSTTDPIQIAMGYAQETQPTLRVAKALRRVYEEPDYNPDDENWQSTKDFSSNGGSSLPMRRGCLVVDVKRKSLSSTSSQPYANFDDAGLVAEAMVSMGADCVFVNVDYTAYGGDLSELRNAVKAVRRTSPTAAVIMKDIVVDEIQIGMAKDAGVDGILLISSVLGPALPNFLDLCTIVGIEAIVEVHTQNELESALASMAQNLLVTNYDRMSGQYFPDQAFQLAGLFPGSGPIVALACGGIETPEQVRELLCGGYDGVVIGKAFMGNPRAGDFIREVREKPLLPAEFAGWGLDDVDVDMEGGFSSAGGTPGKSKSPTKTKDEWQ
jgi:indole-3-glycerol phosphate synthase